MAAGIKALFDRFDRDGSGGLNLTELNSGLKALGIGLGRDQLKALRSKLGGEGAAVISLEAFAASLETHARAEAAAAAEVLALVWAHPRIKDVEDIFLDQEDDGGDGSMAASELCARLQQGDPPLPEAQAAALCKLLVESGSGRVTLKQFQVRDWLVLAREGLPARLPPPWRCPRQRRGPAPHIVAAIVRRSARTRPSRPPRPRPTPR
jgi:Ca2+-binding EF-hand superfamily protein